MRLFSYKALANASKICYTYDELGRVTTKTVRDLSTNAVISTENYSYDAAGNVVCAPDGCYTYDTNNRLTVFDGYAVSYDLDGNMLSNGKIYCTYDSANRLTYAGGISYTYNAEDVRIRAFSEEEDTTYTYDTNCKLSKLLTKTTNDVTTKYIYGRGLIGEEVDNTFKTYHFDCRGSTVAITDANGNVTDTFAYDTYGKLLTRTGTSNVIFGYNGRDGVVTDGNGLVYMRARYYSPDMRRFVNADIVAGELSNAITLNRFAYANGNPVSFVDPFGLSAERSAATIDTSWYTDELSEAIHFILDIAGFIPGVGTIADALNALVYALEGDWGNAAMSALSAIPGLGDIAAGCKWATKFFKSSSKVYKAIDAVGTFVTKIDDVIKNAGKASDIVQATSRYRDDIARRVSKHSDEMMSWYKKRLGDIPDFSKMTTDEVAKWATTGNSNIIGIKGEFLAGIDQALKDENFFEIGGKIRIPDQLTPTQLLEVKNVKYISNTKQLKDYAEYAGNTMGKVLYVRPTTKISPAIEAAGWKIEWLW